ncbi:NAD-dependent protein deacylase sirtuin-5, mitochondrial [Apodemus speciosus]|uniref:NAD-dependent protein deacylase sirtuin-5, mitochondrial n=1 Tax=Apodemus speciosus TaxID=105296 RepID=A0ABQ0EWV9_APOSI
MYEDFEAQRGQVITRKWKRQDSDSANDSSILSFLAVMKSPQGLYKLTSPSSVARSLVEVLLQMKNWEYMTKSSWLKPCPLSKRLNNFHSCAINFSRDEWEWLNLVQRSLDRKLTLENYRSLVAVEVSLCSPGCPGTHSVDQAGLQLRNLPASASQALGLKMCVTTPG